MIQLQALSLSFGEQALFKKISLLINPQDKIGLVGVNGAGKSTLLKVIAGQQALNGGQVSVGNGVRLAYLPQEVVLNSPLSIIDETMRGAYGELGAWHVRARELERSNQMNSAEYATLQADLASQDYGIKLARARKVLAGLGIEQERHDMPVMTLSVGWQMRVVLTQLLLQDADMYLFDEPTNHLDLQAREWLCGFLRQSRSGYLLISHDRYVLDQVCEKTFVLNKGVLRVYQGNYSYYRQAYDEQVFHLRAAKEAQDREIARRQDTIERFRAKASKAKMAKSMEKQLERMERIEFDEEALPEMGLPFPPLERAGDVVVRVQDLQKSFGDKHIFSKATFEIKRGERVAIVAPNGAGKTTLLSCIYGALKQDAGTISFGHNVAYAVFEQEQVAALNQQNTVLEEVEQVACKTMRPMVRKVLGSLLFSGDSVHKKIKMLSGGERNRVALAKIVVRQVNFLILDEPTNHLDLMAQQVLTEGLAGYLGTILFVSHDRDVVARVATSIISLDNGVVSYYPGTYESFLFMREKQRSAAAVAMVKKSAPTAAQAVVPAQEAPVDMSKAMRSVEQDIARLEQAMARAAEALGETEYGTPEYEKALQRYEELQKQCAAEQQKWEALYNEVR